MAVKTDDKPADEEKKEGDKADGDKAAAAGDKKQQRRGQGPNSIENCSTVILASKVHFGLRCSTLKKLKMVKRRVTE